MLLHLPNPRHRLRPVEHRLRLSGLGRRLARSRTVLRRRLRRHGVLACLPGLHGVVQRNRLLV